MPTVNSLPDYITVSYPIAELPRLCRNCKFWGDEEYTGGWRHCSLEESGNEMISARNKMQTQADFGCNQFEVKDAA